MPYDVAALTTLVKSCTKLYAHEDQYSMMGGPSTGMFSHDMSKEKPRTAADPEKEVLVDLCFVTVGVKEATAKKKKKAFIKALDDGHGAETNVSLGEGPSYLHLGADLGDQGFALRFMALGSVLGLWNIFSPMAYGQANGTIQLVELQNAARNGALHIVGYPQPDPEQPPEDEVRMDERRTIVHEDASVLRSRKHRTREKREAPGIH